MDLCLVTFKSYVVQWLAKIAVRRPQLKPLCAIYICHPESAKILQKEDGHFVWCARSFFIVYKNLLAKFIQGFPYWRGGEMGESSHQPKICTFTPSPPNYILILSHQKSI